MIFLLKALLVKVVDGLIRSPVLCLYLRVSFHVANKVLTHSLAATCRDLGGQKKNGFSFCFVCLFVCLFFFVVVVVLCVIFFSIAETKKKEDKKWQWCHKDPLFNTELSVYYSQENFI